MLIQGLIHETFSPGTLFTCQQRIREALNESYEQMKIESKEQPCVGADETGWRTHGKKRWVWIATGPTTTILAITASRSRRCAEELLGKNRCQPTITDRYPAYKFKGPHQYCLAHWKSNIEELKSFEQRELRLIVIRRKICMGTKSRKGEEFLERMYSIYQTGVKRGVDVWSYLKEALICHWSKNQPRHLLDASSPPDQLRQSVLPI